MSTVDPTVKTSRVFDALLRLHDRLKAVSWPRAENARKRPVLKFHSVAVDAEGEHVCLIVDPNDPTSAEWIHAGPATAGERFVLTVVVVSNLPNVKDARTVVERLETLSDAVQGVLWDGDKPAAIGFTNETRTGRWVSVTPALYDTKSGFVGESIIRIACEARL